MSKIYALYGPDERRIDNLKRKIRGYEKMRKDLTNQNSKLNKKNRKYKEVINKLRELIGKHYFKQSDDYYDYFTEGVCLQDGDYQELEDILKEVE